MRVPNPKNWQIEAKPTWHHFGGKVNYFGTGKKELQEELIIRMVPVLNVGAHLGLVYSNLDRNQGLTSRSPPSSSLLLLLRNLNCRGVCVFDGTYNKITTTNYISKTSLYITFCMYPSGPWSIRTLVAENLDVCTACDQ
jgi:hypothetical protein